MSDRRMRGLETTTSDIDAHNTEHKKYLYDTDKGHNVYRIGAITSGYPSGGELIHFVMTRNDTSQVDSALRYATISPIGNVTISGDITVSVTKSVGISTGSARVEFPTSGRVAVKDADFVIGTLTPTNKFEVEGNALIQGSQGFDAAAETATLYLGNANYYVRSTYDGDMALRVNGTTRLSLGTTNVITGATTVTSLTVSGATVLNNSGGDNDIQIQGDTDVNLFFTDASADRVGIGTATPSEKLQVDGNVLVQGSTGEGSYPLFVKEGGVTEIAYLSYVSGTSTSVLALRAIDGSETVSPVSVEARVEDGTRIGTISASELLELQFGISATLKVGATSIFSLTSTYIDCLKPLILDDIKSGATQPGTCVDGEVWKTSSHATLPDNVLMIAVVA